MSDLTICPDCGQAALEWKDEAETIIRCPVCGSEWGEEAPMYPTLYQVDAEPDIAEWLVETQVLVPVEPDDVMNAAHKLVHPMYDNAADCDKFWCEPFRALKKGIGGDACSVRAWAERKGIPMESLRNPAADVPDNPWIGGDDED